VVVGWFGGLGLQPGPGVGDGVGDRAQVQAGVEGAGDVAVV
jgi:hypothetical protein